MSLEVISIPPGGELKVTVRLKEGGPELIALHKVNPAVLVGEDDGTIEKNHHPMIFKVPRLVAQYGAYV